MAVFIASPEDQKSSPRVTEISLSNFSLWNQTIVVRVESREEVVVVLCFTIVGMLHFAWFDARYDVLDEAVEHLVLVCWPLDRFGRGGIC